MEPVIVHIRPLVRIDGVLRAEADAVVLIETVAEPRLQNLRIVLLIELKERVRLRTLRVDAADVRRKTLVERLREEHART